MNFKINTMCADAMVPQVMELSFNQFRELFPSTVGMRLPRPKRLLRDSKRQVFLALSDPGIRLTIYRDGIALYREPGGASAFFVRDSGKIELPFVTGTECLDEDALGGLRWYYPIILNGAYRVEHNQDSRVGEYEVFRFDEGTEDWHIIPHTPDFVSEEIRQDDERLRKESLLSGLSSARENLTPRQKEIITLKYDAQMKQTEIAEFLGIDDSTVSITLHRALNSMAKRMKA